LFLIEYKEIEIVNELMEKTIESRKTTRNRAATECAPEIEISQIYVRRMEGGNCLKERRAESGDRERITMKKAVIIDNC